MPYSKCLPVFIRAALSGTEEIWGGIYSFELTQEPLWYNRCDIISSGVITWVKLTYEKDRSHIHANPDPTRQSGVADLTDAVLCGYKKIFWYLFDLFRCDRYDVSTLYGVLRLMIDTGHSDWFVEYIERFPNAVREASVKNRDMFMRQAISMRDFVVINAIITNELYIKELMAGTCVLLKRATEKVGDKMIVWIVFKSSKFWHEATDHVSRTYPAEVISTVTTILSRLSTLP